MQQIVDLQNDATFQQLNVALVSIATDGLAELESAGQAWKVTIPLLSDTDHTVSQAYGVLQWATPSGEPGHSFVLIDIAGNVRWIQDYGAPQNGGRMYVPVDELVGQIKQQLPPAP